MGKILLLIILVAVAIAWFRARARQKSREGGAAAGATPAQSAGPERMVVCAQCAVHLPASEAVFDAGGTAFCGPAHLEAQRATERQAGKEGDGR